MRVLASSSTVTSMAAFITVARSTATGRGLSIQAAPPTAAASTRTPAVRFNELECMSISCLEDGHQVQAVHAATYDQSRKRGRDDHHHARRGVDGRLHDQTHPHQLAGQVGFHDPGEAIAHCPSWWLRNQSEHGKLEEQDPQ